MTEASTSTLLKFSKAEKNSLNDIELYCDECNTGPLDTAKFYEHRRTHNKFTIKTNLAPSNRCNFCPFCTYLFKGQHNARAFHPKISKTDTKLLPSPECKTCLAKFKDISGLVEHHKEVHQDWFPFFDLFTTPELSFDTKPVKERKKLIQCDVCLRFFSKRSALRDHKLTHTGQRQYQCAYCDKSFFYQISLWQHSKLHESLDAKPYECRVCLKRFTRKNYLVNHQYSHDEDKSFACSFCSKKFSAPEYLRRHINLHSENLNHPFRCEVCFKIFSTSYSLKRHIELIHINSLTLVIYNCDICDKKFLSEEEQKEHIIKKAHIGEEKFRCKYCSRAYAFPKLLEEHIVGVHTDKMVPTCIYCSRVFPKVSNLRKHILKNHKCDKCRRIFINHNLLAPHRFGHNISRPQICDYCEKKFENPTDLLEHLKFHSHKCDDCPKTFPKEIDLMIHKYEHAGQKKYVCNKCLNRFLMFDELNEHIKHVHNSENENDLKNFVTCSDLEEIPSIKIEPIDDPEAFVNDHLNNSPIETIIKSDAPKQDNEVLTQWTDQKTRKKCKEKIFNCDFCPKAYGDKYALRIHRYRHTGEKPFPCKVCDQGFMILYLLKRHMESAHGAPSKEYKCKLCNEEFLNAWKLHNHLQTKHKGIRNENKN